MRKKIMALALTLTCMVSILGSSVSTKAAKIHETELEEYIMEEMASANILGMGISIVSADKELYCAAYGAAKDTEADYVLGSISKSFTAAGIMRMAEDGDLALDDTVSDYLPEYKAAADITIQELLNHTSGITAQQGMRDLEVTGKRGEFQYANANYNLLGEIIEEISGMHYEEYISDNILDPLEMGSTYSMRTGSDLSDGLLAGYQSYFGFPFASKYEYDAEDDWMQIPSGYMISDIKDMGNYLQMYLNGGSGVLSKESIDAMLYNGVDTSSDNEIAEELFDGSAKYAMGWMEKEVNGTKILFHPGNVENFMTMMVLIPEKELGIAMMFNSMDYLVGRELVENLQEGIVAIELEETPVKTDSNTFLIQHGVIDGVMLLAVLASWMPIFLMGVWCRRRRNKLLNIPGLVLDVVIQIVLPTVILWYFLNVTPTFMIKRFVPDLYYVIWVVVLSFYLGGVIKLIAGIVLAILGPKKETEEEDTTIEEAAEKEEKRNSAENKSEAAVKENIDMIEKNDTNATAADSENAIGKSDEERKESTEEKLSDVKETDSVIDKKDGSEVKKTETETTEQAEEKRVEAETDDEKEAAASKEQTEVSEFVEKPVTEQKSVNSKKGNQKKSHKKNHKRKKK